MAALMASSASTEQWIFTGGSESSSTISVLEMLHGFVQSSAAEPFGGQGRRGDGGAAAEGFELGVDDAVAVHLDLQLHHVAAFGGADDSGADFFGLLVQGADVAGVVVVV